MNKTLKQRLVLLDILIGLSVPESLAKGTSVKKYVNHLLSKGLSNNINTETGKYPNEMTKDDWEVALNAILRDEELCNMKISFVYEKYNGSVIAGHEAESYLHTNIVGERYKGDTKMMVFTHGDDRNEPYVIFRGTTRDVEWIDDLLLMVNPYTPGNQEAIGLARFLYNRGYRNAYVSGHSKGGNKAYYITLFSELVKEALGFDAPDFDFDSLDKIRNVINQKKNQMNEISYEHCYVAKLFEGFVKTEFIKGTPESEKRVFKDIIPFLAHAPQMILDKNGDIFYENSKTIEYNLPTKEEYKKIIERKI